jgi:hypothetical protein
MGKNIFDRTTLQWLPDSEVVLKPDVPFFWVPAEATGWPNSFFSYLF